MNRRIRPAEIGDALDVAAIIDIAGHGVDLDYWMSERDSDQSVFAAARRLVIEDPLRSYHYSRAHVIEENGTVAGGLIGALVNEGDGKTKGYPLHLKPVITLETRHLGYWNILAIAVYPEYRQKGLASELLIYAEQLALQSGARGISTVVEDTNTTATTLYAKRGFLVAESQPWIAFGGRVGPSAWLMCTKRL